MNRLSFLKIKFCTLLFLLFATINCFAQPTAQLGDIKVFVIGLHNNSGIVKIGLYNTKESYSSRGLLPAFRSAKVDAKEKGVEYTFFQVPYGEYTIKLFHDENINQKVDKNALGIPKERYGFSNNPKVFLGLPDYKKSKFVLASKEIVLAIKVK